MADIVDLQQYRQQEELERVRRADQMRLEALEEQESEQPEVKKMGWGIFISALSLMLLQTLLVYLGIIGAETIILYILGWILGAIISGISWFILRPYKKSMRGAAKVMNWALA